MKADGGEADTLAGPPRWAARIRRKGGAILGAGILLDAHHVLTCAHVVDGGGDYVAEFMGGADAGVTAVDASVVPDATVPEARDEDDDPSGDIALLRLARARPPGEAVSLQRLSAPNRQVQIYGYPKGYNGGIRLPATVLGAVGRDGQVQLRAERPGDAAQPGCSGAGVMDVATGRVIGMLLSGDPRPSGRGFSFMSPAETIVRHLPRVAQWTKGPSAVDAGLRSDSTASDSGGGGRSLLDPSFAQRLADWLGDNGYPVKVSRVAADDAVREATLLRAITLADRELGTTIASRSRLSDPPGTVPRAGGHDLAVDAAGRTVDAIADRITDRIGLWNGEQALSSAERIRSGDRRLTLVVVGVDEAADPERLLDLLEVMRAHGSRLLLVFRHDGPLRKRAVRELVVRPARERYERVLRLLDGVTGERAKSFTGLAHEFAKDHGKVIEGLQEAYRIREFLPAAVPDNATLLDFVPDLASYRLHAERTLALLEAAESRIAVLLARRTELDGRLKGYCMILLSSPFGSRKELRRGTECGDLYIGALDLLRARPWDEAASEKAVGRFVTYVERKVNSPEDEGGPFPR
jgi:hypothetical protein